MLKLIGFCIRTTIFTVTVLVLGNWIEWDGRTISEHVRIATRSVTQAVQKPISTSLSAPIRAASREATQIKVEVQKKLSTRSPAGKEDLLSDRERMKLRSLIEEVETK